MIASKKFEAIGSIIEVKIDSNNLQESDSGHIFEIISSELKRFESDYSRFIDTSKLSELNKRLDNWVVVDEEFLYLIKKSLDYNKNTEGYFDITVKSTLDKIGYDKNYSFKEKSEKKNLFKKLHHAIKHKLLSPIVLDEKNSKVMIRKEIDFGGIGKGYIIDKISKILDSKNIEKYYVNGGGDIKVKGEWAILLEHPDNPKIMLGKILLKNNAIASSAPNRRKWADGKLHHLINPKTGKPAGDMKSVFILTKEGIDADVYATSLFAAGFREAIKLYKKISKKTPLEVMFVSQDNQYYASDGFNAELFGENN